MKSLLLTYHFNYNYGAILQTYACIKVLEKKGIDTELPNHKPKMILPMTSFFRGLDRKKIGTTKSIINRLSLFKRYRLFDQFRKNYLNINKKLNSKKDILDYLDNFNSVVVGSDQLWNTNVQFDNKFDDYYFLGFIKNSKIKKISFSSCFGDINQKWKFKKMFSKHLMDFNKLSVRNLFSQQLVKKLTGKKPQLTCDPTLLYDYKEFLQNTKQSNTIVVYAIDENNFKTIEKLAKKIKSFSKSKIIFIGSERHSSNFINADIMLNNVGPIEFLRLFKQSKFVVTDSFHGCVFAAKFNKKFIAYSSNERSHRIVDFLKWLKLEKLHITNDKKFDLNIWKNINYKKIDKKINILKNITFNYLKNICSQK